MNNTINSIKYFKLYVSILFIFSVFYLHGKYNVGNDSTISEWLINYESGFTKRGLIGQIAIFISEFFDFSLRQSILFLQIFHLFLHLLKDKLEIKLDEATKLIELLELFHLIQTG